MRVLGIDPGTTVTAFGVVERDRGRLHYAGSGCVRTTAKQPMAERLAAIYAALVEALATYEPDQVAIEAIFRHRSSESALRLGQARGVALLAAGQAGFDPFEYNPMTVKRTIGAHGRADKVGVARMVGVLLGVTPEGPHDVTDALAIAITHCQHASTAAMRRVR
jgi:crossover junction endodeoxyribonuclease RuvC